MDIQTITAKVIILIKDNVDQCRNITLTGETALMSTNLLDSFSLVSLFPVFENEFSIQFDLDKIEISDFETPGSIAEMIKKLLR